MSMTTKEYLELEISQAERSYRVGVVTLCIICAFLVAYFQWLKSQVREITSPTNLATLAVSEVRRQLPGARDALEQQLTLAAPEIIRYVADKVVNESVPLMRQGIEGLFRDFSKEITLYGVEASAKVFETLVVDSKDDLRERISVGPGRFTSDNFVEGLDRIIQQELGQRLTDTPVESANFAMSRSLVALNNINARLQEMATTKNMSRHDELGRRLISTWWTLLQRSEAEDSAAEKLIKRKIVKTKQLT
mgnify:CR=1 FL=1